MVLRPVAVSRPDGISEVRRRTIREKNRPLVTRAFNDDDRNWTLGYGTIPLGRCIGQQQNGDDSPAAAGLTIPELYPGGMGISEY
ncbi:hypothetical protein RSSM_02529 [Rhodopirellula sallentina SM41]|uniref:Uncharacterized protein n=1 Tax=Rhodopirellula sallentina SM41 TaxID=1263870 RepID=M5UDU7_9BACT|nr:hypothetical protein RSSM_02529 [Rhodopirellula sallentina SM41]